MPTYGASESVATSDFNQARKFIETLTGDPETPITWQTFCDAGESSLAPQIIHGPLVGRRSLLPGGEPLLVLPGLDRR